MDFPLPETPVTQIILPKGNSIETFFRLFPVAPVSFRNFPLPSRLFDGTSIFICPLRNCAVMVSEARISAGVPSLMISPPYFPAFGPISIT
ncbi:hypothetical protein D3C72_865260 [compost metagenome]